MDILNVLLVVFSLIAVYLYINKKKKKDQGDNSGGGPSSSNYTCDNQHYKCIPDSNGRYNNIQSCNDNCKINPGGYNCSPSGCVKATSGGKFKTEYDCNNGSCPPISDWLKVTVLISPNNDAPDSTVEVTIFDKDNIKLNDEILSGTDQVDVYVPQGGKLHLFNNPHRGKRNHDWEKSYDDLKNGYTCLACFTNVGGEGAFDVTTSFEVTTC
jgi:hypothetical protein